MRVIVRVMGEDSSVSKHRYVPRNKNDMLAIPRSKEDRRQKKWYTIRLGRWRDNIDDSITFLNVWRDPELLIG